MQCNGSRFLLLINIGCLFLALLLFAMHHLLAKRRSSFSHIIRKPLVSLDTGIITCDDTHTKLQYKKDVAIYDFGTNHIEFSEYIKYIPNPRNASLDKKHKVAIIIRTYKGHATSLIRLIRGLLQQTGYNDGFHILITSTEYDSIDIMSRLIQKSMRTFKQARHSKQFTIEVLNFSRSLFYDVAVNPMVTRLASLCDPLQRQLLVNKWNLQPHEVTTTCKIDNPIHYFLTDLSIHYATEVCPSCNYLMITNGDNYYYGAYLRTMLQQLQSERGGFDFTLSDWNHRGVMKTVAPSLGNVDLGCSVFRIESLQALRMLSLTNALQGCPDARDYYSADGHFIETLVLKGAKYFLSHNYLFDHN